MTEKCNGKTTKGKPCKRDAVLGGYCISCYWHYVGEHPRGSKKKEQPKITLNRGTLRLAHRCASIENVEKFIEMNKIRDYELIVIWDESV